jgi:hypothetical protein
MFSVFQIVYYCALFRCFTYHKRYLNYTWEFKTYKYTYNIFNTVYSLNLHLRHFNLYLHSCLSSFNFLFISFTHTTIIPFKHWCTIFQLYPNLFLITFYTPYSNYVQPSSYTLPFSIHHINWPNHMYHRPHSIPKVPFRIATTLRSIVSSSHKAV